MTLLGHFATDQDLYFFHLQAIFLTEKWRGIVLLVIVKWVLDSEKSWNLRQRDESGIFSMWITLWLIHLVGWCNLSRKKVGIIMVSLSSTIESKTHPWKIQGSMENYLENFKSSTFSSKFRKRVVSWLIVQISKKLDQKYVTYEIQTWIRSMTLVHCAPATIWPFPN